MVPVPLDKKHQLIHLQTGWFPLPCQWEGRLIQKRLSRSRSLSRVSTAISTDGGLEGCLCPALGGVVWTQRSIESNGSRPWRAGIETIQSQGQA